ncbi:M48 family metallopeptidase [Neomoorella mulderi]|uniref:Protease HtpX n=1 Tax=Moorella mulderi DSM 14980 TaxID=1122241 RepID=A0A151AZU1_9FIRM|nr:M48 family metallopeptidase [Moorella mulderi]KYH33164.1 protease HtpX [Moorella mulderi DSM 14980]
MTAKASMVWTTLLILAGIFSLAFIFFTLFPGQVPDAAWQYFTPAEVERARHYQQTMRLVSILAFLAQIAFLVWLVASTRAAAWSDGALCLTGGRYYPALVIYFVLIWLSLKAVALPFNFYSSFIVQHQWGFSTQTLTSWWLDYLKGGVLDLILSGAGVLLLFWATGRWPHTWWAAAGLFLSGWLFISAFLWPLLVAPLFNRFQPIPEGPTKTMVTQLAGRAGLKVKEVLVMDASSRTTKANAYFTGLGATKRIVLYDTLLADYPPDEVEAVIAHEMAHWQRGHILRGLLWGIVANFLLLGLLYAVLKLTFTYEIARPGPYPPHLLVAMLLFIQLVSFLGQPVQNAISRCYETEADRVALELTGNPGAMIRLQVDLARKNLGDVALPAFIEWLSSSHPSPLARIQAVEKRGKSK